MCFADAVVFGLIVAVMEANHSPDWWRLAVCALAAMIVSNVVANPLVAYCGAIGFAGGVGTGATVAGIGLVVLAGMTVSRAFIAASLYFVIQTAIYVSYYHWFAQSTG